LIAGKLELKGGGLTDLAVGYIYIYYAPQASSASPRSCYSEVRRSLDLPPTTSSKPGRTAIECNNEVGSGSSYACTQWLQSKHPLHHQDPTQTDRRQLATGDWLASGCERGTRHHPSTKNKNQGGDQGRRHRPVRVAFRLRTACACTLCTGTGTGQGPFVGSRSTCAAAAALRLAARPSLQVAAAARAVGGRNFGAPLAMLSS
jgi:hypothetical protein